MRSQKNQIQQKDGHVWQNLLNVLKLISIVLVLITTSCTSSISLFKSSNEIQYKEYSISERNSFLPREYREIMDSAFLSNDYIDRKLNVYIPDTFSTPLLYDTTAPLFSPYVNDSGIVLCERDMALYIAESNALQSARTELKTRKQVHVEIIRGALEADSLYRATIIESNKYNKEIYDEYNTEKAKKRTWRNIALFVLAFSGGFIINEYVTHD